MLTNVLNVLLAESKKHQPVHVLTDFMKTRTSTVRIVIQNVLLVLLIPLTVLNVLKEELTNQDVPVKLVPMKTARKNAKNAVLLVLNVKDPRAPVPFVLKAETEKLQLVTVQKEPLKRRMDPVKNVDTDVLIVTNLNTIVTENAQAVPEDQPVTVNVKKVISNKKVKKLTVENVVQDVKLVLPNTDVSNVTMTEITLNHINVNVQKDNMKLLTTNVKIVTLLVELVQVQINVLNVMTEELQLAPNVHVHLDGSLLDRKRNVTNVTKNVLPVIIKDVLNVTLTELKNHQAVHVETTISISVDLVSNVDGNVSDVKDLDTIVLNVLKTELNLQVVVVQKNTSLEEKKKDVNHVPKNVKDVLKLHTTVSLVSKEESTHQNVPFLHQELDLSELKMSQSDLLRW